MEAIDGCLLALTLGATFVARSFSGDKGQLVPILKAGLAHKGFAFVDVLSPCVTFNDHEGSTKSYAYTREERRGRPGRLRARRSLHHRQCDAGSVRNVMLHDGSWVRLRKVAEDYEPTDRDRSCAYSGPPEGRRDRDRLHLAGFRGHARTDRDRGSAPDPVAIRGAVSGRRGAGKAAKALPVTKFPIPNSQSPTPQSPR